MASKGPRLTVSHGCAQQGLVDKLLEDLFSESPKSLNEFVEFECEDDRRHVHRVVLKIKHPGFKEPKEKIPVSSAIFDNVIEFIYKGETSFAGLLELIATHEVARLLNLSSLAGEIETLLESHLQEFLRDQELMKTLSAEDFKSLARIVENLRFADEVKLELLRHIETKNLPESLHKTVLECGRPHSMCCFAITSTGNMVLLDAITLEEIEHKVDLFRIDASKAVIIKNTLVAKHACMPSLLIVDMPTGQELQVIPIPDLEGITFHEGDVYVWTSAEIILLKPGAIRNQFIPELLVTSSALQKVCILRRHEKNLLFARQIGDTVQIVNVTNNGNVCEQTVLKRVAGSELIGNIGDQVYIFYQHEESLVNLHTYESFRLEPRGDLLNRRILNGVCFSLVLMKKRMVVWRTDLKTRRTLNSGLVDPVFCGFLIPSF